MLIDFFRRAVRAEGTRALLTGIVGMVAVLVNLLFGMSPGCAGYKPARRAPKNLLGNIINFEIKYMHFKFIFKFFDFF